MGACFDRLAMIKNGLGYCPVQNVSKFKHHPCLVVFQVFNNKNFL